MSRYGLQQDTNRNNRKVAIVGAGFVGATIAYALTISNIAREVVLIDIDEEKTKGEALDIQHGIPFLGIASVRAGQYEDCADCDLIIITAGRSRRNGESRLDMVNDNVKIMKNVIDNIKKYYTRGCILVVSNPVDLLTYYCDKWMGLPNGRVFGTGCILDTSRLVRCIADYVGLNTEAVRCYVVGEHGDSQFPVWSHLYISGMSMDEYCGQTNLAWSDEIKDNLYGTVKNMGAEIIKRKGRTHYGIATCVCYLAGAVINQRPIIAPVSTPLCGEYGIEGVALSIPSIIGTDGVRTRLTEKWTEQERAKLIKSADGLKNVISGIRIYQDTVIN